QVIGALILPVFHRAARRLNLFLRQPELQGRLRHLGGARFLGAAGCSHRAREVLVRSWVTRACGEKQRRRTQKVGSHGGPPSFTVYSHSKGELQRSPCQSLTKRKRAGTSALLGQRVASLAGAPRLTSTAATLTYRAQTG